MAMSVEDLRKSPMMSHLLDALDGKQDIGHYGRLVFAMIARHFLAEDELVEWIRKDSRVTDEQARALVLQVQGKDYSPPRRERILEWQRQQDFQFARSPTIRMPATCIRTSSFRRTSTNTLAGITSRKRNRSHKPVRNVCSPSPAARLFQTNTSDSQPTTRVKKHAGFLLHSP